MNSRSIKIFTVIVVMSTTLCVGFLYGFSSSREQFNAHPQDGNGTIIAAVALKNINVNGEIQVQYSGQSAGNATILLQNGTHYVVSDATPTITIKFHFDATRFVGASSISGGIMNLSLNQQSPLFSGAVYNVSVDFFQTKFPGYVSDQFSNYFSIYIENAASVIVAMDGAPF